MSKKEKTEKCPYCGEPKTKRGLSMHMEVCPKNPKVKEDSKPKGFCKCNPAPGYLVKDGQLVCVKCGGLSPKAKFVGEGRDRKLVRIEK